MEASTTRSMVHEIPDLALGKRPRVREKKILSVAETSLCIAWTKGHLTMDLSMWVSNN